MENAALINQFYEAFKRLDGEAMAACYHEDIEFEDPAFGSMKGTDPGEMWRMLCHSQKGKDFRVTFSGVTADGDSGSAHWEAHYHFGKSQRPMHNIIEARFKFRDGKIIEHIDRFDLYRWSRQAMGLQGTLLGWTPFFKKKLNQQTAGMLAKWKAKS